MANDHPTGPAQVHGIVTNAILYMMVSAAVAAPAVNRTLDPATLSTIVAESVNNNLSAVE